MNIKAKFSFKLYGFVFVFIFTEINQSFGQIDFVNFSSGYGIDAASQNLGSNVTYNINNTSVESVKGSLGRGVYTNIGVGHNLNKIVSCEIGISYLEGHKFDIANANSANFINSISIYSRMLRLTPKLRFSYNKEKSSYYLKVGILYKLFGRVNLSYQQNDLINSIQTETERIFSGGNSIGLFSSIGMLKRLNEFTSLILEIENINQSWAPKKDVVSKYLVDGIDMQSNLTPYQKQTNYYKKFEMNRNNPSENFYARKQTLQYFPFNSICFKIGICFLIKKKVK